jgi:large subunit ribosomal protein L18
MSIRNENRLARERRHSRVRKHLSGTTERPRLNVFKSLVNIYAQVIDDTKGHTLVAASTLDAEIKEQLSGKKKAEQAAIVGKRLAEKALEAGIQQVVFDRGGYQYHGRVKALAEASRESGLTF